MEHHFLEEFFVVCLAACIGGYAVRLTQTPKIVGFLIIGALIGPKVTGFVGLTHLHYLMGIGAGFMLFEAGAHFRFGTLAKQWRIFIVGGTLQVTLTTAAVLVLLLPFGFDLRSALVIGMLVSLSSTAQAIKLLEDHCERNAIVGKVAIGILLLQDLFAVPYNFFTQILGGGAGGHEDGGGGMGALKLVGFGVVFLVVVMVLSKYVLGRLLTWTKRQESEQFSILIMTIIGGAFYASEKVGLSIALGGFIAGVVVGQHKESRHAVSEMRLLKDLFGAFFFVVAGAHFDPTFFLTQPFTLLLAVVGLLVVKILFAGAPLALLGLPYKTALTVGIYLSSVGEFGFVLASAGLKSKLFTEQQHGFIMTVGVFSMLATPLLLRLVPWIERKLGERKFGNGTRHEAMGMERAIPATVNDHFVVIGKGPTADLIITGLNTLRQKAGGATLPPIVVVEQREENVEALKEFDHVLGVVGDGAKEKFLRRARICHAKALIITAGDFGDKMTMIRLALALNKGISVFVRAQFHNEEVEMRKAGAQHVILDEGAAGKLLVDLAFKLAKVDDFFRLAAEV